MKWISAIAIVPMLSWALPVKHGEHFRVQIPGEYIVKNIDQKSILNIKKRLGKNLYLINAPESAEIEGWPNYAYYGNYMESTPNDERFGDQYHHGMIQTINAWNVTKGDSEVIVAVTDNEFRIDHEDMQGQWWTNQEEIPGNNIDDDNNGYVDDVYGWDFIANDNDVSEDTTTHGTHISGIIAAKAGNNLGVVGIAPNVKVMPLRWYGEQGRWTSAIVAETYHYAVDHGAKIINTSYNIDILVNDKVYLDAIQYAVSNDVLIFNSAGNNRKKDPARVKLEDIILVCSVKSSSWQEDKKSSFSNYGEGIDICAPGDPVLSTVNRKFNTYGSLYGTSMASPVAAAVAALIWSAHPNLSANEVKERLYMGADDIEEKNEKYRGMLGHGRVNAFKSVQ